MSYAQGMQCRICGSDLEPRVAVSCARCRAAFHRDCWSFNGRCGIYGCGGRTFVGFDAAVSGQVEIHEGTRAPLAVRPYAEGAVRALVRWGKLVVPAGGAAGVGSFLLFLVYRAVTGIPFDPRFLGVFLLCGVGNAVLAVPLGGTIRRHATVVAWVTAVASTGLYALSRVLDMTAMADARALAVGLSVILGMLFGNALAERLTAPWRFEGGIRPWLAGVVRPPLTGSFLFLLLVLLTAVFGPGPLEHFIPEVAVVSLLGLFVAAPPLELSKSAAVRRKLDGGD